MKNILSILTVFSFLVFASCADEDLDRLLPGAISNGAVLTTVEEINLDIDKGDPANSTVAVSVQFNDFASHNTMDEVAVYVEFIDTTPVNNEVVDLEEQLLTTMPASAFTVDEETGYPTATLNVTGQEAIDGSGVDASILDGGDLFILRLALKTTDGIIYSSNNVGEDVAVTSHNAPFRYAATVKCLTPEVDYVGSFGGITNATNTDGQPNAVDLAYDVTVSAVGDSGLTYEISDVFGGAYITFYGDAYGYTFETTAQFDEICGKTLTGSISDAWGQNFDLVGEIIDADTFSISWENPWGDEGTTVYTRQ